MASDSGQAKSWNEGPQSARKITSRSLKRHDEKNPKCPQIKNRASRSPRGPPKALSTKDQARWTKWLGLVRLQVGKTFLQKDFTNVVANFNVPSSGPRKKVLTTNSSYEKQTKVRSQQRNWVKRSEKNKKGNGRLINKKPNETLFQLFWMNRFQIRERIKHKRRQNFKPKRKAGANEKW